MNAISIQPVKIEAIATLADIGRRTFERTFASGNNPEDLAAYLEKAFSPEELAREMGNPQTCFYFARIADKVAGYLKINWGDAQTEAVEGRALEIERIYVDKEMQGKGVGKALFQFAIDEAKNNAADVVWLGVWEDNRKAIRFYSRQGFEAFGEHQFTVGSDVQRDILMRRKL